MRQTVAAFLSVILFVSCSYSTKHLVSETDLIDRFQTLVIEGGDIGRNYIFEREDSVQILRFSISYLGSCKRSGIKLAYQGRLTGNKISPHFSADILVFSGNGKKLGSFYIGSTSKPELSNDTLYFKEEVGCTLRNAVGFKDSIPTEFFLGCTLEDGRKFGDVYGYNRQR